MRPLFESIDAGRLQAVTSTLTLMEVLVVPLRAGQVALARQYEDILRHTRGLRVTDVDAPHVRAAAQLRARWPTLRTPDAIQLATALLARCSSFVTNDARLPPIAGLNVVQVRTYVR